MLDQLLEAQLLDSPLPEPEPLPEEPVWLLPPDECPPLLEDELLLLECELLLLREDELMLLGLEDELRLLLDEDDELLGTRRMAGEAAGTLLEVFMRNPYL